MRGCHGNTRCLSHPLPHTSLEHAINTLLIVDEEVRDHAAHECMKWKPRSGVFTDPPEVQHLCPHGHSSGHLWLSSLGLGLGTGGSLQSPYCSKLVGLCSGSWWVQLLQRGPRASHCSPAPCMCSIYCNWYVYACICGKQRLSSPSFLLNDGHILPDSWASF